MNNYYKDFIQEICQRLNIEYTNDFDIYTAGKIFDVVISDIYQGKTVPLSEEEVAKFWELNNFAWLSAGNSNQYTKLVGDSFNKEIFKKMDDKI